MEIFTFDTTFPISKNYYSCKGTKFKNDKKFYVSENYNHIIKK